MRVQCNNGCPTADNMVPIAVSKNDETVTFLCKTCDNTEKRHVRGLKTLQGLFPSTACPDCLNDGSTGRMITLGIQQRSQGYDRVQTYNYQCMEGMDRDWETP